MQQLTRTNNKNVFPIITLIKEANGNKWNYGFKMIADNQVDRAVTQGENNNLVLRNIVWHLQGDMIWK